jgi:hypothetical protein
MGSNVDPPPAPADVIRILNKLHTTDRVKRLCFIITIPHMRNKLNFLFYDSSSSIVIHILIPMGLRQKLLFNLIMWINLLRIIFHLNNIGN